MKASSSLTARPMSPTLADTSITDTTVTEPSNAEQTSNKCAMTGSQTLSEDDFTSFEEVKQQTSQNASAVAMVPEKEAESEGVSSIAVKILLPGGSSEVKEEPEGGSSTLVQDLSQAIRFVTVRYMSQCMRFPTMWYVRPAYTQSDQSLC